MPRSSCTYFFSTSLGKKDLVLLRTPQQRANLDSSAAMSCLNCDVLFIIMPRHLTELTTLIGERLYEMLRMGDAIFAWGDIIRTSIIYLCRLTISL